MLRKTQRFLNGYKPLAIAIVVTLAIVVLRLIGAWELFELKTFDLFLGLRPPEAPEKRIAIIALQESEIQQYGWPVSDRLLANLISTISAHQPRVIGLDLFRDIRVEPGYDELDKVFQSMPNLFGIEKVVGNQFEKIAPPPVLKAKGQTSASDLIADPDGVVRRYLLFPAVPPERDLPSLGIAVALKYLPKDVTFTNGSLQIGDQLFPRVTPQEGGYVGIDAGGYQMLLNYREPSDNFEHVSFSDVLNGQINHNVFKDRIVLIGSAAPSTQDLHLTPYSWRSNQSPKWTWGVEIHAQAASQVLSSVLNDRPLIQSWAEPWEELWIFGWILVSADLVWRCRFSDSDRRLVFLVALKALVLSAILLICAYLGFLKGHWLPVFPILLGIWATAIAVTGYIYISQLFISKAQLAQANAQLQKSNATLEARVQEQTQALRQKNEQLIGAVMELETLREQQITIQKSASLGNLASQLVHEIKNPVSIVFNQAQLALDDLQVLKSQIEDNKFFFNDLEDVFIELEKITNYLDKKINVIDNQGRRTARIINQVLNFARQKAPDIKDFCLTNIQDLIDESCRLVDQERQNKQIEVEFEIDYDNSIEQVEIVREHINGALINLINNAWDALEIKKQKVKFYPKIFIGTQDLGRWIALTIQDNGEGMASEVMPKIFELFFSTKKSSGKGTGLGLFFVKQIIENEHRGKIEVETKIGDYTKFTLLLPKKLNFLSEKMDGITSV